MVRRHLATHQQATRQLVTHPLATELRHPATLHLLATPQLGTAHRRRMAMEHRRQDIRLATERHPVEDIIRRRPLRSLRRGEGASKLRSHAGPRVSSSKDARMTPLAALSMEISNLSLRTIQSLSTKGVKR